MSLKINVLHRYAVGCLFCQFFPVFSNFLLFCNTFIFSMLQRYIQLFCWFSVDYNSLIFNIKFFFVSLYI